MCPSISTVFNNIEVTTAEGHINFIVHTRRPDPTRPDPTRSDLTMSPSSSSSSSSLCSYITPFAGNSCVPWLTFHKLDPATKKFHASSYSRSEFLALAIRSAFLMKTSYGVVSTSRVLHLFTSNTIYDLIARYAHTILDSIGVTTNWSSDTNEKIVYKANVRIGLGS